jgi:hypothetical protein
MRKYFACAFAMSLAFSAPIAAAAQTSKQGMPTIHVPYSGAVKVPFMTTAQLPICDSFNIGIILGVTDATTPTYNGAVTGGSNVAVLVVCNGAAWKSM